MLILTTCRNDDPPLVHRVRQIFSSRARTTWIDLEPLNYESLGKLASMTLQRNEEDIAPLTRLVTRVSMGNPFQARNLLQTVWRQGHVSLRAQRPRAVIAADRLITRSGLTGAPTSGSTTWKRLSKAFILSNW